MHTGKTDGELVKFRFFQGGEGVYGGIVGNFEATLAYICTTLLLNIIILIHTQGRGSTMLEAMRSTRRWLASALRLY
jgi:hypothetical protein